MAACGPSEAWAQTFAEIERRRCGSVDRSGGGSLGDRGARPAVIIGVDVGGTKISVARVRASGDIEAREDFATPYPAGERRVLGRAGAGSEGQAGAAPRQRVGADAELAVRLTAEAIDRLLAGVPGGSAAPVGVAVAGSVEADRRIGFAPNLNWRGVDFAGLLERASGRPVRIDNDANLAALGEAHFGCRARKLFCAVIGTGVGGGIVIDGRVLRGRHGWAGEFGHVRLLRDGPQCNCGRRGCLEALSSGLAIEREWKRAAPDSDFEPGFGARAAFAAAEAGDPRAVEVIAAAGRHLGAGLAAAAWLLDPEAIVLSGGLSSRGPLLLGPLREEFRLAAPDHAPEPQVSSLGRDAGLYGAAALWLEGEQACST